LAESPVPTAAVAVAPTTLGDERSSRKPECRIADHPDVLELGLI
jgi:hypothetical protein